METKPARAVRVQLSMAPKHLDRLDTLARESGVGRSEMVRILISAAWIDREGGPFFIGYKDDPETW